MEAWVSNAEKALVPLISLGTAASIVLTAIAATQKDPRKHHGTGTDTSSGGEVHSVCTIAAYGSVTGSNSEVEAGQSQAGPSVPFPLKVDPENAPVQLVPYLPNFRGQVASILKQTEDKWQALFGQSLSGAPQLMPVPMPSWPAAAFSPELIATPFPVNGFSYGSRTVVMQWTGGVGQGCLMNQEPGDHDTRFDPRSATPILYGIGGDVSPTPTASAGHPPRCLTVPCFDGNYVTLGWSASQSLGMVFSNLSLGFTPMTDTCSLVAGTVPALNSNADAAIWSSECTHFPVASRVGVLTFLNGGSFACIVSPDDTAPNTTSFVAVTLPSPDTSEPVNGFPPADTLISVARTLTRDTPPAGSPNLLISALLHNTVSNQLLFYRIHNASFSNVDRNLVSSGVPMSSAAMMQVPTGTTSDWGEVPLPYFVCTVASSGQLILGTHYDGSLQLLSLPGIYLNGENIVDACAGWMPQTFDAGNMDFVQFSFFVLAKDILSGTIHCRRVFVNGNNASMSQVAELPSSTHARFVIQQNDAMSATPSVSTFPSLVACSAYSGGKPPVVRGMELGADVAQFIAITSTATF